MFKGKTALVTGRLALPAMKQRGFGRIVNIASAHALVASAYKSAYVAAKHGIAAFTKTVALEVAEAGITVNAVCPGYLKTEMTSETIARIVETTGRTEQQALEAILQTTPQRRLIEADEVAEAVLYLCGENARGVTGSALVIDGGELRR